MTSDKSIDSLLEQLDGSGSDTEWAAVNALRELLDGDLPRHLLELYRRSRSWKTRSSCVYHAVRYARESDAAVTLGKLALRDRSKVVRYRACMLLAYSQRHDVLPELRGALEDCGERSAADLLAAIDAIESRNHHYFLDRDHSGQVSINVS